jgi:hypothetical protein
MAGDDDGAANIEALKKAIDDAQAKADAGEEMYLVRANHLRKQLAALTIPTQQPEAPSRPQSLRMTALNEAHTEATAKAKAEEKSTEKNLEGVTQVTVVPCAAPGTLPCVPQPDPAGASPHAPDTPPRGKQKHQSASAKKNFTIRISDDVKAAVEAKASAVKSYPSAYILGLIAADLRIPLDEEKLQRGREMQDEIAALTVALNRQGNNINQIAKATNEGKPCALSRPEISETLRQHTAAVSASLRLGFGS